jgi:corrinoid protein of di/trimethylamine methyltransferase
MAHLLDDLADAVVDGELKKIAALTQQALDSGTPAGDVLNQGLLPGMEVVGRRFKAGEIFIPEVLLSAKTMGAAMEILKPILARGPAVGKGTVVIGTVQGDLHNIGKNLVAMMLEGGGFDVIDLGIDVKPQAFVDAVKAHKPALLGMSALLTTTMPRMSETVRALREAGIRDQLKIMVGGAPVGHDFAAKIGADAYAPNAAAAVDVAKALVAG